MSEASVKPREAEVKEGTLSADTLKAEYKINNNRAYLITKRIFDVVVSIVGGIVLMIPMMVVAVLIWMESPGPVIFKQERLGKDGKPFMMYKFRSMHLDSERNGPQWAEKDDDRCTKIGKVIRICHIDELPQLINIIKGDMSIVGPRPERSYFYNVFEKTIPNFRVRLQVTPGLTGWAQVNGGYDLTPEEKLAYDIVYMENRGVWMDILCMFKTFFHLLDREGVR